MRSKYALFVQEEKESVAFFFLNMYPFESKREREGDRKRESASFSPYTDAMTMARPL